LKAAARVHPFINIAFVSVVVVGATAKVLYCKDQLPCFELEFSACDENGMREVCLVANFGDECSKSATLGDSISHVCTRPAASTEGEKPAFIYIFCYFYLITFVIMMPIYLCIDSITAICIISICITGVFTLTTKLFFIFNSNF